MKYRAVYSKKSVDQLKRLEKKVARKIIEKISYYCIQKNPFKQAKKLIHPAFGQYRFRIGEYRAIFDIDAKGTITILYILSIKHRKDVYKNL